MNTTIDTQLTTLQNKLQQLLKQYRALQAENEQLKKEIEKNKQISTASINSLQKIKATNTSELEIKIDKYIAEIDRCLLLLNAAV
jgi:vacuolar-type H+-ATPase subunit D/Vma8